MARVCSVCNKGMVSGHNVTHSNRHNKRTWAPNLRRVKAVINGSVQRINVCTRCLRSGKVERAI
ncbi:50S ribosomal protein L28 [Peptostreptococcaceae bacterium AGR-M142]|jgi:large subunit ribosomal protein L28|nr:50S ribosomal protein L28 [Peptostreptococcaceae bacterium]